jgi:DNA replication protein DnaC
MNREKIEIILKNLRAMRLTVMANQLVMMIENSVIHEMTTEEILIQISQEELLSRKNNTINRLKKKAKLNQINARVEDIDYRPERKINKSVIEQLISNDYIIKHRNVIILGACGTGKTFIASSLGNHACENYYTTYYCRFFEFLDECTRAMRKSESIDEIISKYLKFDVLIIDDFLIHEPKNTEIHYLLQLMEYRYNNKTTIFCSQIDITDWHRRLGGSHMAESIMDRIISIAYKIILEGDSMRHNQVTTP